MTNKRNDLQFNCNPHITRNILLNLLCQGLPLVLAVFTIPILIKGLGIERFGVLTLAWMVIGYFTLLDLGLGRALTKLVAEKLGSCQKEDVPALIWSGFFLILILGLVGALIVVLLSPFLVHRLLKIPTVLQPETLRAFYLLALCTPIIVITIGFRGILEAAQCFPFINFVRISVGAATFLSPLAVLPFSNSLFPIVAILGGFRLLACLAYSLYCLHIFHALRHGITIQRALMKPLLSFGGWVTVSNIISPLMVYLDRFVIATLVSMAAVAYYATPYEVVTKLVLIPNAIVQVLFPNFASSFAKDSSHTAVLYARGVKFIFLTLFPITLVILTLGHDGLAYWLGIEFAKQSTRVLQLLALGVFFNSHARIPSALIQSLGRPDLTAVIHLIELPFYILAVWWMTRVYGIEGTACVWLARIGFDTLLLFGIASWLLPSSTPRMIRTASLVAGCLSVLVLAMFPISLSTNRRFLFLTLLTFGFVAWFLILSQDERTMLKKPFKTRIITKTQTR